MRFISTSLSVLRQRIRSTTSTKVPFSSFFTKRRNMVYHLVLGGYRDTIPLVSFDPSTAKLKVVSETAAPEAPSWVEAAVKLAKGDERVIYCVSENEKEGEVVSVMLRGDKMEVTSRRKTRGAPCHILALKDGSGIVVANYMGGTVVFFPTEQDGTLSQSSESPDLEFPFVYKDRKAPNAERQDTPHLHQAVEGPDGHIFCPDLGNDRVWVVSREGDSALAVKGWLQCPEGAGPRHCAISPDAKHLYVLTELSHQILVFPLNDASYPKHPLPQAEGNIVPPSVPATHQKYMDAGECVLHPSVPNVVYASNRWELHLKEKNPDLPAVEPKPSGDAIAVVLLGKDGSQIEQIKHVRTGCDTVRGMRISHDGKYVALGGQEGGGLEIWEVSGERGDVWKLAAKDESIKSITDCLWL